MIIERTFQGAWCISETLENQLYTMQYMGYTKREAVARFKEHLASKRQVKPCGNCHDRTTQRIGSG